jgi:hypothetical protein
MKLIETKMVVKAYIVGKGFDGYQLLTKQYKVFGFIIYSQIIDREEVPSYARIAHNTLGSTDWKSKFAQYF